MEKTKKQVIVEFEIENGILICKYQQGLEINIDIAHQMIKDRRDYIKNKSYPTLLDARGLKSINREAREYSSSDEGYEGVTAGALLSGSIFTSYIGNFFLKITSNKPNVPLRLFTDKQKAMEWLAQFI